MIASLAPALIRLQARALLVWAIALGLPLQGLAVAVDRLAGVAHVHLAVTDGHATAHGDDHGHDHDHDLATHHHAADDASVVVMADDAPPAEAATVPRHAVDLESLPRPAGLPAAAHRPGAPPAARAARIDSRVAAPPERPPR